MLPVHAFLRVGWLCHHRACVMRGSFPELPLDQRADFRHERGLLFPGKMHSWRREPAVCVLAVHKPDAIVAKLRSMSAPPPHPRAEPLPRLTLRAPCTQPLTFDFACAVPADTSLRMACLPGGSFKCDLRALELSKTFSILAPQKGGRRHQGVSPL